MGKETLETVGIKLLRDSLSSYLRKVSLGVRVLVSDRGRIIAEIIPPGVRSEQQFSHPKMQELFEQGLLSPGRKGRTKIASTGVQLEGTASQDLLDADRGS